MGYCDCTPRSNAASLEHDGIAQRLARMRTSECTVLLTPPPPPQASPSERTSHAYTTGTNGDSQHDTTTDSANAREQTVQTLRALSGVQANDEQQTPRDRPRLVIEPIHALLIIGVLVIALATSLTLLVQQSVNMATVSEQEATTSTPSTSADAVSPTTAAPSSTPSATQDPNVQSSTPAASTPDSTPSASLIDLNTASQAQLESIRGIGPVTASNIIAYRTTVGRFASVDDLLNISGIGSKTLEKIRPFVQVK